MSFKKASINKNELVVWLQNPFLKVMQKISTRKNNNLFFASALKMRQLKGGSGADF
jgi:hypothetical protein